LLRQVGERSGNLTLVREIQERSKVMNAVLTRRQLLWACGLAVGRPAFAAPSSAAKLSFIQLTDTHVSARPLVSERLGYNVSAAESVRRCRSVVKDINECSLPYELIVHTGDVAHTHETSEDFDLARELLEFKRSVYFVPGNHDLGYSYTARYRPAFEKRFGLSNQAIQPVPNLRLAMFDSQPLDFRASDSDRQAAFGTLDHVLTRRMPTILFCHVTGIASFHLNRFHEAWPEETIARWTEHMKRRGVFAVIAGHFHRDELHVLDGLPFYLAGPVINFWGRQTTYRHWTLANGVLSYRTIYLEL
jgi:predicted phosphodiesterase